MKTPYRVVVLPALALLGLSACNSSDTTAAQTTGTTYYVSATADKGGDGSHAKPFDSLETVEKASLPGDTIVVLASPEKTPALDGGISLQPGQRLLAEGNDPATGLAARITNTKLLRGGGDAVLVTSNAEVAGITIVDAYRSGIAGVDVRGVNIHDNDISGFNTSCSLGFTIPSDTLPTTIPRLVVPFPVPLPNGRAGIMMRPTYGSGSFTIRNNAVHDARCGDGIDVVLSNAAQFHADIIGNTVSNLQQGPITHLFLSVLAIGLQTRGDAQLDADINDNVEHDIGSLNFTPERADSEGLFFNPVDATTMTARVNNNTFLHGIGGFSANGMEFVSMGKGATATVAISNSTFTDVPGDILELLSLGSNATLKLTLDKVTATHSTGGPLATLTGLVASANVGNCLAVANSDGGNALTLGINNSEFSDCFHDALSITSNDLPNSDKVKLIDFEISNSRFTTSQGSAFNLINLAPLAQLRGKVSNSVFSGNKDVNLTFENGNSMIDAISLDFGGGAEHSAGGNCIVDGGKGAASTQKLDVALQHNWWGQSSGPAAKDISATGGTLDTSAPLASAPGICR